MFTKARTMPASTVYSQCLAQRMNSQILITNRLLLLGLKPQQRYFCNRKVAELCWPARLCQDLVYQRPRQMSHCVLFVGPLHLCKPLARG